MASIDPNIANPGQGPSNPNPFRSADAGATGNEPSSGASSPADISNAAGGGGGGGDGTSGGTGSDRARTHASSSTIATAANTPYPANTATRAVNFSETTTTHTVNGRTAQVPTHPPAPSAATPLNHQTQPGLGSAPAPAAAPPIVPPLPTSPPVATAAAPAPGGGGQPPADPPPPPVGPPVGPPSGPPSGSPQEPQPYPVQAPTLGNNQAPNMAFPNITFVSPSPFLWYNCPIMQPSVPPPPPNTAGSWCYPQNNQSPFWNNNSYYLTNPPPDVYVAEPAYVPQPPVQPAQVQPQPQPVYYMAGTGPFVFYM